MRWMAIVAIGAMVSGALGDVFHLTNGGKLEGQLLRTLDDRYVLRTYVGEVTLSKDEVERVEFRESIFDQYDRKRLRTGEDAAAQFALARWCVEHDLPTQARTHFQRVIEDEPDHAAAREALGYVREGGAWVMPQRQPPATQPTVTTQPTDPNEVAKAQRANAQAELEWDLQVIVRQHFMGRDPHRHDEGRALLMSKAEAPLAAGPLFRVLTWARWEVARVAVVDALAELEGEEATEYLVIAALEDEDEGVRERALHHLHGREAEAVDVLRRALREGVSRIETAAAEVLAELGAKEAIPDLINVLRVKRERTVESHAPPVYRSTRASHYDYRYATYWGRQGIDIDVKPTRFGGSTVTTSVYYLFPPPWLDGGHPSYRRDIRWQRREVPVFQTEVREALRRLTGQDFGFDEEAWRDWYERERRK